MFESTMNIRSMYVDIESTCTYDVLEARLEKTKMEMWGLDLSINELVRKRTGIHNDMDADYNPNDAEEEEVRDVVKGMPKGSTKRGKVCNITEIKQCIFQIHYHPTARRDIVCH